MSTSGGSAPGIPETRPGLAARVAAERNRIASERGRLQAAAKDRSDAAEVREAEIPEVLREFEERITELQRERDRQVGELRADAEGLRREAQALIARCDAFPSVSAKSLELLRDDLDAAQGEFAEWLARRTSAAEQMSLAKQAARDAVGEAAVREYEEIRRRAISATDPVERKAYGLAETSMRASLQDYADALDRADSGQTLSIRLIILVPEDPMGRLLLVLPIKAEACDDAEVLWRLTAFLVEVAERAARDMGSSVTTGQCMGCMAAEIRPWAAEPELMEIAIQECWDARPSLRLAGLSVNLELIPGVDPEFDLADSVPDEPASQESVIGETLLDVSQRLGMSIADTVASLVSSGLPFPDDVVEHGVEESLRELLGLRPDPVDRLRDEGQPEATQHYVRSDAQTIASRLLAKLVRDRRIGGRTTAEHNVWGHHFADDEKDTARELTYRLVRAGLLISKARPGGAHVSINPRRMNDVAHIIDRMWKDPSLFGGLS